MDRKRIWLNSPNHNYSDKIKYLLSNEEINQFTIYSEDNTKFIYGDFVNASCVTQPNVSIINKQPNYMIIMNGTTVESRWFVVGLEQVSGDPLFGGSWRASLKRDVIVDYKDSIKNTSAKIIRGNLDTQTWSPVLVAPEGLNFSEIKVAQENIELWDGPTRWLTIFYDHTLTEDQRTITFNNPFVAANFNNQIFRSDLDKWGFSYSYNNDNILVNSFNVKRSLSTFTIWFGGAWNDFSIREAAAFTFDFNGYIFFLNISHTTQSFNNNDPWAREIRSKWSIILPKILEYLKHYRFDNSVIYQNFRNKYDSKNVNIDSNNTIVKEINVSEETLTYTMDPTLDLKIKQDILNIILENTSYVTAYFVVQKNINQNHLSSIDDPLRVTNIFANTSFYDPKTTSTIILPDLAIDEINLGCLTIPFGGIIQYQNNAMSISEILIKSISTTGWTNAGDLIKDIQILPYCPSSILNSFYINNPSPSELIVLDNINIDSFLAPIKDAQGNTFYYGISCLISSQNYRFSYNLYNYKSNNFKVDSMTKKIRFVSPEHGKFFDLNPTYDNLISSISFMFTLRPIKTIYRMSPVFSINRLYGGNYQDYRGLIFEGNLSLSNISSPWINYQLNNSTYQQIFDRDYSNLEISQETARRQETLSYNTSLTLAQSALQATAQRAAVGAATAIAAVGSGNPLIGIGGAISSINAGILGAQQSRDMQTNFASAQSSQRINDTLRSENLSYKSDIFSYNIKAIQAKPNSLASNSDITVISNNKVYIEYYDTTTEESNYLQNIIRYNGMKIEKIGNINDYLINDLDYIEAVIIRFNDINPPIANQINNELKSGCYIQLGLFDEGDE